MKFERADLSFIGINCPAYSANAGPWQFLMLDDNGNWTVSYRLRNPTGTVSASSTMMGPFDSFSEAENAAQAKWQELRRMA